MKLTNTNTGQNLKQLRKKGFMNKLINRLFVIKNSEITTLLMVLVYVLVSVTAYMKMNQKLHTNTNLEVLRMYQNMGRVLKTIGSSLGGQSIVQHALDAYTAYLATDRTVGVPDKIRQNKQYMALFAALFVMMSSQYGPTRFIGGIHDSMVQSAIDEAESIQGFSITFRSAARLFFEQLNHQAYIAPDSHKFAEQIRKEIYIPIYSVTLALIRNGMVQLTPIGYRYLKYLSDRSLPIDTAKKLLGSSKRIKKYILNG